MSCILSSVSISLQADHYNSSHSQRDARHGKTFNFEFAIDVFQDSYFRRRLGRYSKKMQIDKTPSTRRSTWRVVTRLRY